MLVCCSVISVIVLLAVFGVTIIAIIQAIFAKIDRTAWAKTLVDLPMSKLESELTVLKLKRAGLVSGFLGMSKTDQQKVTSEVNDVEARTKILEQMISEQHRQQKFYC